MKIKEGYAIQAAMAALLLGEKAGQKAQRALEKGADHIKAGKARIYLSAPAMEQLAKAERYLTQYEPSEREGGHAYHLDMYAGYVLGIEDRS